MNKLLEWDTELFVFLNNLGTDFWDPFWLMVSGTIIWIPLYAFLAFLVFRNLKGIQIPLALVLMIFNLILTDQGSVSLFKEEFERLRPCHVEALIENMRMVKGGCGGKFGFVSSHAANTFGLAVLIGLILKKRIPYLIYIMLAWAIMVSYSRVYLGVHYPLDITGGAIFGTICGMLNFWIFKKVSLKYQR